MSLRLGNGRRQLVQNPFNDNLARDLYGADYVVHDKRASDLAIEMRREAEKEAESSRRRAEARARAVVNGCPKEKEVEIQTLKGAAEEGAPQVAILYLNVRIVLYRQVGSLHRSLRKSNTPCPSCHQAPFSIDLNQASVEDTVDDGTLMMAPADKSNGTGSSAMPLLKELTHVATGSILRRIKLVYAMSSKIEVLIQELIEMRQQHRLFSVCEHAGPDPMEAALGPVFSEDGLRCAHPTWRNEREKQR
jgi:hypothetical protein